MKRTALVTGASRGIGAEIASLLKDNDIKVLAPARAELDLLSNRSINGFFRDINFHIDILVNNAGINPLGEIAEIEDKNIEETLKINLASPLKLIRGVLPGMVFHNYGRIVNISSIWSEVSKPGRGIYSASKAGLDALTRTLAVELAGENILINSVAPGFVDTELTQKNNSLEQIARIKEQIPLRRLAEPKEIAELVLFLCSEKNSYITGQTILIDGGYTCQ